MAAFTAAATAALKASEFISTAGATGAGCWTRRTSGLFSVDIFLLLFTTVYFCPIWGLVPPLLPLHIECCELFQIFLESALAMHMPKIVQGPAIPARHDSISWLSENLMSLLLRQDVFLDEFRKHCAPAAVAFSSGEAVLVKIKDGPLDHCGDLHETDILRLAALQSRADNPESNLVRLAGEDSETLDPILA